jgi:hypothetical protein
MAPHAEGRDHTDQGNRRADRKVKARRQNRERLAERNRRKRGRCDANILKVLDCQEHWRQS